MPARPTDWLDTIVGLAPTSGGALQFQSLMGAVSNIEARRYTCVRTLVRLDLQSTTVAGAWGSNIVHIGIGVVSVAALAAGAASLPNPSIANDKPALGWLYRTTVVVAQNGIGTPVVFPITADVRGSRKIDRGDLVLMIDNVAHLGTTATIQCTGLIRCLMKL